MDQELLDRLERRLGRLHAKQRLGIETDDELRVFGGGLNFFHIENWYSAPIVVRTALRLTGLYWRAQKNAKGSAVRENVVRSPKLPERLEDLTILHIRDLHGHVNAGAMRKLPQCLRGRPYRNGGLT